MSTASARAIPLGCDSTVAPPRGLLSCYVLGAQNALLWTSSLHHVMGFAESKTLSPADLHNHWSTGDVGATSG